MADGLNDFPMFLITIVCGAVIFLIFYISRLLKSADNTVDSDNEVKNKISESSNNQPNKKQIQGNKQINKKKPAEKRNRDVKASFNHSWLLTSLKGHSTDVLDMDFSANGKFLATCGEDRAVFIWSTKDWNTNDHKHARINIEYDHATIIRWSPDSKAFIVKKSTENVIEAYKIVKRNDGWIGSATVALTYPKFHKEDIVSMDISSNGKYIITCSEQTDLVVCDIKGTILAHVDTYLMNTYHAGISPCGKFITASGFAPDAKVWEVQFAKSGEFNQVARAFELRGHTSGIHQVACNNDSSRMVSLSKDGTWRAYLTNVEYNKGEDPRLIESGKYKVEGVSKVCLSPGGDVVAVSSGSSLSMYFTDTGELDTTIRDIYSGPITCVRFDSEGKYVLTCGRQHVRVFHNVTGYKARAALARAKLQQSGNTAATIERLETQLAECEAVVASLS